MKKQTKVFATLSAAALLAVGVSAVSMAAGWDNSTGEWRYLDNNGDAVTDTWKSANGNWFYLNSDGVMATNQLIEDNNNSKTRYYYVDQYGAMVTNTWKAVAMDDNNSDLDAEYWWYYFGKDGKAYTSEDDLTTSEIKTIGANKYAFDSEGHMLYGWINKDNVEQQDGDDEAWKTSQYYFNGWNDGHMQTGWIQLTVEDDNDTKNYWFNFKNDGKKRDNSGHKKINGAYYHFAEDGHMLTNWAVGTSSIKDASATTSSAISYLNGDGAERKNKWVWAVPDEDSDTIDESLKKDYDDDEYSWWYFNNSGKLTTNTIKKINGKKYAFDQFGRMLTEFVAKKGNDVVKLCGAGDVDRAGVLAGQFKDVSVSAGDEVYWFSKDKEKDGSMKKGYQTIELDDGTYQFYFNTSSGVGANKYTSKIKKFAKNGLVLAPTSDDDSNYGAVTGVVAGNYSVDKNAVPTGIVFGEATEGNVLVNRAGTIVTSKPKLKDNNDEYYVVNKDGVVLAHYSSEDEYNKALTYDTANNKKISMPSGYKDWTPANYDTNLQNAVNAKKGTNK